MKFLSTLLLFSGYLLIYAAVAKGGRFATEPWEGVFHDAYTGEGASPSPGGGQGGGSSSGGHPGPRLGGKPQPFPRRGPIPGG